MATKKQKRKAAQTLINFTCDPALRTAIKRYALDKELTLRDVMTEAIVKHIKFQRSDNGVSA